MFRHFPLAKPRWPRTSLLALAVLASLVFLGSGCSRFTRTRQCRALIAQTNPALDDVLLMTHGVGSRGAGGGEAQGTGGAAGSSVATSNGYIAAAGRYERLSKQLGPLEFGSEDMAKMVAEY